MPIDGVIATSCVSSMSSGASNDGDDLARDLLRFLRRVDVFQHDGELVAAQARDGVLRPHGLLQARGGGAQDAVAGGVAERIVDVLEAVQVEEQHRDAAFLAARAHDRARQALGQQRAVRQAGQRVVVRQVAQFLLGALLVGDVGEHARRNGCAGRRRRAPRCSRSSTGIPRRPCAAATSRRTSGRCVRLPRASGGRNRGRAARCRAGSPSGRSPRHRRNR